MEFEKIFSENELIVGLRNGDKIAYTFIFKNYYKLLCLYAISFLHNNSEAEDMVQLVMIKIWEKRSEIQVESSLMNYLYRSVKNQCLNEIKSKNKRKDIIEILKNEAIIKSIKEEEDNIVRKLAILEKEIQSLPKKSKEIFILNKRRGFSYKEIADILGLSEKTVESHLARAMKRIKNNVSKMSYVIFI